jgi:FSR family fosmidomycin resistance protein-like MFS transporter
MAVDLPWRQDSHLALLLVLAMVPGKACGGILADRFGWTKIAVTGAVLAAPLLTFLGQIPALAILGAFLLQWTMPVTLVAVARLFPRSPGFAFGLPCLALVLGALPAFTPYRSLVGQDGILLLSLSLWLGAGLLYLALTRLSESACGGYEE